ncbi:MAG: AbrB/MazE/SpoVT family DNA-binding domain-containing protein [bacterium]
MVTRMRDKGQVTIPSGIRESLHLPKNAVFSVAKVGDGILLTPKISAFESAAAEFSEAAKKKGVTLAELLGDLKRIRRKDS